MFLAHAICCISWFGLLYALVHSGIDVVGLLQTLHLPDSLIEKVQNVPESAGIIVVALILYKVRCFYSINFPFLVDFSPSKMITINLVISLNKQTSYKT